MRLINQPTGFTHCNMTNSLRGLHGSWSTRRSTILCYMCNRKHCKPGIMGNKLPSRTTYRVMRRIYHNMADIIYNRLQDETVRPLNTISTIDALTRWPFFSSQWLNRCDPRNGITNYRPAITRNCPGSMGGSQLLIMVIFIKRILRNVYNTAWKFWERIRETLNVLL